MVSRRLDQETLIKEPFTAIEILNDRLSLKDVRQVEMAQGRISVENTGSTDLFLTVVDLLSFNQKTVLDNRRLNGNETIQIDVELNGDGSSSIRWKIISAEDAADSDTGESVLDNLDILEVSI